MNNITPKLAEIGKSHELDFVPIMNNITPKRNSPHRKATRCFASIMNNITPKLYVCIYHE